MSEATVAELVDQLTKGIIHAVEKGEGDVTKAITEVGDLVRKQAEEAEEFTKSMDAVKESLSAALDRIEKCEQALSMRKSVDGQDERQPRTPEPEGDKQTVAKGALGPVLAKLLNDGGKVTLS